MTADQRARLHRAGRFLRRDGGVSGPARRRVPGTMAAMADLLTRPPGPRAPRRPPAGPPIRPLTPSGVVAALQAAGLGALAVMVLVLVGWATAADSGATATAAVTGALQAWLVAHHTRLMVPGGTFDLVPLGLTLLPVLLLHSATVRAGRAAGVHGRRGVVALTSAVTATYAVVVTVVALLARTDQVRPLPMSAFVGASLIALVSSGSGAVRATGRTAVLWHRLPGPVRAVLPPAAAGGAVLVAGGATLAGASLAVHHGRAADLTAGLGAGVGGALLLLLGCLLYLPTAVVWGLAFCVGPGFAVGEGTGVGVAGTDLGAVPTVPLLAGLPSGTGGPAWWLALLVPAAAGVLAGLVADRTTRRSHGEPGHGRWRELAETSAGVGGTVGLGTAVLAWLASGSMGPGRMAVAGPTWWLVGLVAALEVTVLTAATRAVLPVLRGRR
jgi:hypothetical protein